MWAVSRHLQAGAALFWKNFPGKDFVNKKKHVSVSGEVKDSVKCTFSQQHF
jgi:hypothetical protein